MSDTHISVVIPVFNAELFLAEAIDSVLAQDTGTFDIIVVDDGSTDDSAAVASRFGAPVQVIRQANAGPAAARNRGLAAARGEYVAFLDQDDLYCADKFSLQSERLDHHPEVDVVIGQHQYLMLDAVAGDAPHFSEYHDDHLSLQLGCCLFRRSVFERVGLFDETYRLCDDWDWFMRAREAGVPLLIHQHVVLRQRIHTANLTRQREAGARQTMLMVRRSLARRRSLGVRASLPPLASYFEREQWRDD